MTSSRRITTEDHRPPSTADEPAGAPVLLGAFPTSLFLPFPGNGAPLGREDIAATTGHTDLKISTVHVRCGHSRGVFSIEDAGSRNGTFVNGALLSAGERVEISDGTVVRLGQTLFVFRSEFRGPPRPEAPIGKLVGPWGLGAVRASLRRVQRAPSNVLIEGQTGVGKELLAPEVAAAAGRDPRRFAAVNVAAFPETMFEGQLFGWEKGAFSSAVQANRGVFREHDGGTVFLDEIGELPRSLQPKLLRLLENREVWPIGASRSTRVELLIVGATNRSLTAMVEANDFRADLLARFPIRLTIPPLADRPEDLHAILEALWARRFGPLDPRRTRVDVEAVERMMLHDWPANVREMDRLLATVEPGAGLKQSTVQAFFGDRGPVSVPILRKDAVVKALAEQGGNQSAVARKLGVNRARLLRFMEKQGIRG